MSILDRYIGRLFAARVLALLLGLAVFVTVLDTLASFDEIVAASGAGAGTVLRYAALRFPDILTRLVPFAVLIAALLTLTNLVRHHELVVLMAAGISQFRVMRAFAGVAVIIAVLQFALSDGVVPAASRLLREWGIGEYGGARAAAVWARDGHTILRVRRVDGRGGRLYGVTIFGRDADGTLITRTHAREARYGDDGWTLFDVVRLTLPDGGVTRAPRLAWAGQLAVSQFEALAAHPRELALREIAAHLEGRRLSSRPSYLFETWRDKRLAAPFASVLMILFAVPLAQQYQRSRGGGVPISLGVAIGFVFFVVDEFTLTLGEAGLLPPLLAAGAPTVLFASLGGAIAFHVERG